MRKALLYASVWQHCITSSCLIIGSLLRGIICLNTVLKCALNYLYSRYFGISNICGFVIMWLEIM